MKVLFTILLSSLLAVSLYSQTAVNFTCNDCSGNMHDLYSELDEGNVIVICWVMPCAGCVGPSYETYTEVQSFEATHPGRVRMYICDDEGTLNCPQLVEWCLNSNMLKTTRFSDSLIRMTDYGTVGMPKIVVLGGGTSHKVYYNANDSVDNIALHDSIVSALMPDVIYEKYTNEISGKIFPNPADLSAKLVLNIVKSGMYSVNLFDQAGRRVSILYDGYFNAGEQNIEINTSDLYYSEYFIQVTRNKRLIGTFQFQKVY